MLSPGPILRKRNSLADFFSRGVQPVLGKRHTMPHELGDHLRLQTVEQFASPPRPLPPPPFET